MSVSERALPTRFARTATAQLDNLHALGSALAGSLARPIRAVAFWVATLLPLSYLPLLSAGVAADHPLGFVALLCANAVAFVLGHTHKRDADGTGDAPPAPATER
jgi:hypothetical protein